MNVYLYTLGCKVNTVETDSIAALLREHGYTVCDDPADAQVIVLNSCTVTASGDKRMHRTLRSLRSTAPDAVIVLTGCYAQAFPEEAAAIPEANIVTGTKDRHILPSLISDYLMHPERHCAVRAYTSADSFESLPVSTDTAHTRAFLKIQDGCDRFCTYCIIPYARGRSRSRPLSDIQKAAEQLRSVDFQELVLCGINLACWGRENGLTIANAVEVCAAAGFPRVRLGSLEPDGLTADVLHRLAAIPALCPHFHISVQSGCDRTLAAMHRRYTCADYAQLLSDIRRLFPGAAITTDLMVGFPGETEKDFEETLRFTQQMAFSQVHVFRYSPRPGTAAASYPSQVSEEVKKFRADCLNKLAHQMHLVRLAWLTGQTLEVLFERERGDGYHIGHAASYETVL
ncbi:MAG: tRNA (N(6)-L-threonylcarbamoyladenosine(37)-C(2))-methylthiotransferase MtaB, partial [Oscillospiraceae bacterium]|nr:tRNA (N(6)-L-threonylcarbamoyladenosine(37)-C(2))-methylthiotransferase MtaB [Oscillospiraceae bacterium]